MQNINPLSKINGINPNFTINRGPDNLNLNPTLKNNGSFIFKQTENNTQNNQQQSSPAQSNQSNTNTHTNQSNV